MRIAYHYSSPNWQLRWFQTQFNEYYETSSPTGLSTTALRKDLLKVKKFLEKKGYNVELIKLNKKNHLAVDLPHDEVLCETLRNS